MSKKETAALVAFDLEGKEIDSVELSLYTYWEELHPLVDSDTHRASLGVRRLEGTLYEANGTILQSFENFYSPEGQYQRGRAEHADGTVTED